MKLRPDWQSYLRTLRRRELEAIFRGCPPGCFVRGLELGAGDGFQSTLLTQYAASLVVTDYYPGILQQTDTATITHQVCDAEHVGETFSPGEFDLIFSSNMLEHLPRVREALAGMHGVLRDEGIAIHVMPSPFWKLCQMVGFYPNFVMARLERYSAAACPPAGVQRRDWRTAQPARPAPGTTTRRSRAGVTATCAGCCGRSPHGAAGSNLEEFRSFRPAHWRAQFAAAGFTVAHWCCLPPMSSGYGFGLDPVRTLLERVGLASEYAYVVHKTGHSSPYLAHFPVRDRHETTGADELPSGSV